jgi:hypothetical protein
MSARNMESFLACLYVDSDLRARFRTHPRLTAERAGLAAEEVRSVEKLDLAGLELASRSFAAKRASKKPKGGFASIRKTVHHFFTSLIRTFRRSS